MCHMIYNIRPWINGTDMHFRLNIIIIVISLISKF